MSWSIDRVITKNQIEYDDTNTIRELHGKNGKNQKHMDMGVYIGIRESRTEGEEAQNKQEFKF